MSTFKFKTQQQFDEAFKFSLKNKFTTFLYQMMLQ